jgi:DNA-binding XRE family transcriptional regulator
MLTGTVTIRTALPIGVAADRSAMVRSFRHSPLIEDTTAQARAQARALGERIRIARRRRSLRVEGIARKAGIGRKTVEAVEKGSLSVALDPIALPLAEKGFTSIHLQARNRHAAEV